MRILVIDDDISTVDVILSNIDWERFGADEVYPCYNIASAKKYFENGGVEIAVCDIEMPMGSGLDLLQWAREKGYETQFIFLTSHERFDYANTAIRYRASGYVVKPFHKDMMEEELVKAVQNVQRRSDYEQAVQHEEAFRRAIAYVEASFLRDLFDGQIPSSREAVLEEMKKRHLDLAAERPVRLVLIDSGYLDAIEDQWEETARYETALSSLVVRLLQERLPLQEVFIYHYDEISYSAAVLDGDADEDLLMEISKELCILTPKELQNPVSVYLAQPCFLWELSETGERLIKISRNNVALKGRAFKEEDPLLHQNEGGHLLVPDKIRDLLTRRQAKELLEYCRFEMEHSAAKGKIDKTSLLEARQDLWQGISVFIDSHGVQNRELFSAPSYTALDRHAADSVLDMMRWLAAVVTRSISYVEEVEHSDSVAIQAKNYINAHFTEDITRTEVAASLYLNPEYMAKIFKKETGISVKQYITDCRMEKAKTLLAARDVRISEVAQQVGYDNFSYFSTLFRKATGMTPVEYHNMLVSS